MPAKTHSATTAGAIEGFVAKKLEERIVLGVFHLAALDSDPARQRPRRYRRGRGSGHGGEDDDGSHCFFRAGERAYAPTDEMSTFGAFGGVRLGVPH